jgi:hypothetical protein
VETWKGDGGYLVVLPFSWVYFVTTVRMSFVTNPRGLHADDSGNDDPLDMSAIDPDGGMMR